MAKLTLDRLSRLSKMELIDAVEDLEPIRPTRSNRSLLNGAAKSRDVRLRAVAAVGLIFAGAKPPRPFQWLEQAAEKLGFDGQYVMEQLGEKGIPHFEAALRSKKAAVRRLAAYGFLKTLRNHGDRKAVAAVIAGLNDKDAEVRSTLLDALASAGRISRGAVPAMTKCLADRSPGVRLSAVYALTEALKDVESPTDETRAAILGLIRIAPQSTAAADALAGLPLTQEERRAAMAALKGVKPCAGALRKLKARNSPLDILQKLTHLPAPADWVRFNEGMEKNPSAFAKAVKGNHDLAFQVLCSVMYGIAPERWRAVELMGVTAIPEFLEMIDKHFMRNFHRFLGNRPGNALWDGLQLSRWIPPTARKLRKWFRSFGGKLRRKPPDDWR